MAENSLEWDHKDNIVVNPSKILQEQFASSDNEGVIIEIDEETGEMKTISPSDVGYEDLQKRALEGDDVILKNINVQTQMAGLKAAVFIFKALEDPIVNRNPLFLNEAVKGIVSLRKSFLNENQSTNVSEDSSDFKDFRNLLQDKQQN